MAIRDFGRVRAPLNNGIVKVKALLRNPMETGSRKHPGTGEVLPRQFIQEATVSAPGLSVGGKAGTLAVSSGPSAASGDLSGFSGRAMSVGA
jgi:hypothetical protein